MSLINALIRNTSKNVSPPFLSSYFQLYHKTNYLYSTEKLAPEDKPVRKKTVPIQKITLISDNNLSVTTLDEAQKLSKRRDLKLVKIIDLDTKTKRPVYKLMTGAEYHQEELKQRVENKKQKSSVFIKGEKLLLLKDNIGEHDLEVHGKKILKWLLKSYQINVVINASNTSMEKSEKIYSFLETFIKDGGRLLQKRTKGTDLRFQIIPPKREDKQEL